MNTTSSSHKLAAALAAVVLGGIVPSASASSLITPSDWYQQYSANRGDHISNGDTGNPNITFATSGNPRSLGAVWSYFDKTSLTDGGSITVTTEIQVNYTSNVNRVFDVFRFGLFKSDPDHRATTDAASFGNDRYVSDLPGDGKQNSNWSGFMINVGASGGRLFRRNLGDYLYYSTTTEGVSSVALDQSPDQPTFNHNTPLGLTFTLSRSGDDLIISGILGGSEFSGVYASAFVDYSNEFDTLGFWTSNTVPTTNLVSASFSNTAITVIPEPTTGTLGFLMLSGFGAAYAKRKLNGRAQR